MMSSTVSIHSRYFYSFIQYGDLYSTSSRLLLRSAPDPCTAKKKSFAAATAGSTYPKDRLESTGGCYHVTVPLYCLFKATTTASTQSELRRRGTTGNYERRTCSRSLRGGWSGIRTCHLPDARHRIYH